MHREAPSDELGAKRKSRSKAYYIDTCRNSTHVTQANELKLTESTIPAREIVIQDSVRNPFFGKLTALCETWRDLQCDGQSGTRSANGQYRHARQIGFIPQRKPVLIPLVQHSVFRRDVWIMQRLARCDTTVRSN